MLYVIAILAGIMGGGLSRLLLKDRGLGVIASEVVGGAAAILLAFNRDSLPLVQRAGEVSDTLGFVAYVVVVCGGGFGVPFLVSQGLDAVQSRGARPAGPRAVADNKDEDDTAAAETDEPAEE